MNRKLNSYKNLFHSPNIAKSYISRCLTMIIVNNLYETMCKIVINNIYIANCCYDYYYIENSNFSQAGIR